MPRTHDLEVLHALVTHPQFALSKRNLGHMTQYAVDYRYPGLHASSENARSALRYAEQARIAVRKALGLPLKRDKPGRR